MEHKERMLKELNDLIEKKARLEIYLEKHEDEPADEKNQKKIALMKRQRDIMEAYICVLNERIMLELC